MCTSGDYLRSARIYKDPPHSHTYTYPLPYLAHNTMDTIQMNRYPYTQFRLRTVVITITTTKNPPNIPNPTSAVALMHGFGKPRWGTPCKGNLLLPHFLYAQIGAHGRSNSVYISLNLVLYCKLNCGKGAITESDMVKSQRRFDPLVVPGVKTTSLRIFFSRTFS